MTPIRWTPQAAADLQQIHDFIAVDSPHYAAAEAARVLNAIEQLAHFPRSGRLVPERPQDTLRELIRPPYRIVYRITGEAVHILMIFRASRVFPDSEES